ncbi:MAG: response regulator [Chloroflexota bacterium]|nr:response regulator [Chloroflexota bacterium]
MNETKGHRVLVIGSEPEIGELIEFILGRGRNDEVKFALGGRKGLAVAEQEPPDLIFLDVMMPDLDGWEVYRRLRMVSALQNVPVLFQSPRSPEMVYPEAQRLGAAGFVRPPYGPQELLAARDAALRGDTYYPPLPEEPELPSVDERAGG